MKQRYRRSWRRGTLPVLAVLLAFAGLAACGGTDAATPASPGASAAGSPGVSTSPGSLPVAVREFRGMLPFVFTQALVKDGPYRRTRTVGGVVQSRGAHWVYRDESSDPRLAGRYDVVINLDQRQSDMSGRLWGTGRLSNEGGSWVGKWTGGIAAGGDVHHVYLVVEGRGGYAGLVAHLSGWFVEAGEGFTPDVQIVGAGWMESADGGPVPPAPGPGTTPAAWTPVVGIATTVQTAYDGSRPWIWDLAQSDPRVDGQVEGAVEEIGSPRADGSIDFRASNTITNPDGSWNTPAGPIEVRGPKPRYEHFIYSRSAGSGAYAGLTYHSFWYFPEPRPLEPGDTFVWTGWIDERE